MTEFQPNAAVLPVAADGFRQAIIEGGGQLVDPARADVMVWTDPHGPEALRAALAESPARWVQLPLAGIERFVALGVIDPARVWTSAKGIYGYACAEHALALMLMAARRIHTHVLHRTWEPAPIGSRHRLFKGSTVLVVGTGGIGRALMPLLTGLDVRVLAASRSGAPVDGAELTVTTDRLPELVPKADFDRARRRADSPDLAPVRPGDAGADAPHRLAHQRGPRRVDRRRRARGRAPQPADRRRGARRHRARAAAGGPPALVAGGRDHHPARGQYAGHVAAGAPCARPPEHSATSRVASRSKD